MNVAVYTDVVAEDLGAFLAGYDVGELLAYKGIAEGVENSNFLVHTSRGYFILTLYERRVAAKDLPFFLALMEHLHARGISCPQPVENRRGEVLGQIAGRPAAMITFLDGMWIRRPSPTHCAALGEALARLHLAGLDFERSRANTLSVSGWRPLYENCSARANEVQPDLKQFLAAELSHLEKAWPSDLPQGVIHADLFPDNVFFLGNKLSGLIDFYFACTDALAYDVAICLNAWCFETDHSYNVTKGRSLLQAYAQVRPLSDEERRALPLLARGARSAQAALSRRHSHRQPIPAQRHAVVDQPMEAQRLAHQRQKAGQECRSLAAARCALGAPPRALALGARPCRPRAQRACR